MTDAAEIERRCVALCRNGNPDRAHDDPALQELAPAERRSIRSKIDATTMPEEAVFVPCVAIDGAVLLSTVQAHPLGEGDDDVIGARVDHAVVLSACDDAWRVLEGTPARPRLRITFDLIESLDLRVVGPSIYLATLIAAARVFADRRLGRNVVATGHPYHALGDEGPKRERSAAMMGELRHLEMVALASGRTARIEGDGEHRVRWVQNVEDALLHVFRGVFLVKNNRTIAVQIACGPAKAQPVARFLGRKTGVCMLPDTLVTYDDYQAAWTAIDAHLDARGAEARQDRFEVAIGGPLTLAASLGVRFRNKRRVWLIDRGSDGIWWHSDQQLDVLPIDRSIRRDLYRVVVTGKPDRVPARANWDTLSVGALLTPDELPSLVQGLLPKLLPHGMLHLAVDGPGGLAFALGAQLANHVAFVFHERVHGAGDGEDPYRPVFAVNEHGVIGPPPVRRAGPGP